jgi:hypothetical protein
MAITTTYPHLTNMFLSFAAPLSSDLTISELNLLLETRGDFKERTTLPGVLPPPSTPTKTTKTEEAVVTPVI